MFQNLNNAKRSWIKTGLLVVGLLVVALVFGSSGSDDKSPFAAPEQTSTNQGAVDESQQHEGDENFGELNFSQEERNAIRVAERVAKHYGGFPSRTGDFQEVIPVHLKRLKPVVTESLLEEIRIQLNSGERLWTNIYYKTEVRSGSYFTKQDRSSKEVVVTISKTVVNSTANNVPVDNVLRITVKWVDGKFRATSIAQGKEGAT